MISTVKSTCSSPAWAEYRSGVLVAVPKFGEELDKALMEQREKDIAATDAFMKEYRKTGGKFKLTAEQLKTLSDNYNPRDMSYKEYMSFIDRLCEYGILNEDDKDYVHYSAFGSDFDNDSVEIRHSDFYLGTAQSDGVQRILFILRRQRP